MNRQLSSDEVAELERSFSVETLPVMTRREKLLRFAQVVRNAGGGFVIYSNLEYQSDVVLAQYSHPCSAFAAAVRDPVLNAAGLKGDSVLDAKRFFELSTEQLHEFSCDCGGAISNEQMADRIEYLAELS